MRLAPNFSLSEFTRSDTARIEQITNIPSEEQRRNLVSVAAILQEIRDALGKPVRITSGFRCLQLNTMIGGAKSSDHMWGRAADFNVKGLSIEEVFKWVVENINPRKYRIVIQEGGWIHLSTPDKYRVTGLTQRKVNRVCISDTLYSYKG